MTEATALALIAPTIPLTLAAAGLIGALVERAARHIRRDE